MSGTASERPPPGIGRERQFEVYVDGARGAYPGVPVSFERLEQRRARRCRPRRYAYIAGGAGREETIAREPRGVRALAHRARACCGTSRARATSVDLLGTPHAEPVPPLPDRRARDGAPRGGRRRRARGRGRGRPDDLLEPGVAADGGVRAGDGRRAALVPALLEHLRRPRREPRRARRGVRLRGDRRSRSTRRCSAGACRDLDLAYLPFLRGKGIAQYTSDPVFLERSRRPLRQAPPPGGRITLAAIAIAAARRPAPIPGRGSRTCARGWRAPPCGGSSRPTRVRRSPGTTSPFLRERTRLPILLKGILHPADARLAVEHGIDGIVVSNHGGRQVDGAIATIDALPGVVEAVGGPHPGRSSTAACARGADVFSALALGATAVRLGRPYVYGLAVGGEEGVREVIRNLARRLRPDDGPRRMRCRDRDRARLGRAQELSGARDLS